MRKLWFVLVPLLTLGLLAGCATAGGGAGGGEASDESVEVRVDNNLVPSTSITVFLISQSGFRNMLGRVSPNSVRSMPARGANALGEYRLVGERTGGRDVVSRTFYLTQTSHTVRWDLSTNTITVIDN